MIWGNVLHINHLPSIFIQNLIFTEKFWNTFLKIIILSKHLGFLLKIRFIYINAWTKFFDFKTYKLFLILRSFFHCKRNGQMTLASFTSLKGLCPIKGGITNNLNLVFRVDLKICDWGLSYQCSIIFHPELYF